MLKILEIVIKTVTIAFFIFFLVGGIVVLRYCIGIDYFPIGIDIGDGLFFLSVATSFIILFSTYLVSIYFISLSIVWAIICLINSGWFLLKRRMTQMNRINWIYAIPGLIIALLFFYIYSFTGLNQMVISTLLFILFCSSFIFIWLLPSDVKKKFVSDKLPKLRLPEFRRRFYLTVILLFCSLTVLYVPSEEVFQLSRFSLIFLGISKKPADIYLDSKMEPVFNGAGTVNEDYLVLNNAEILWTGVGSRSVIQVPINGKPRKFVVNTDEMSFSY